MPYCRSLRWTARSGLAWARRRWLRTLVHNMPMRMGLTPPLPLSRQTTAGYVAWSVGLLSNSELFRWSTPQRPGLFVVWGGESLYRIAAVVGCHWWGMLSSLRGGPSVLPCGKSFSLAASHCLAPAGSGGGALSWRHARPSCPWDAAR